MHSVGFGVRPNTRARARGRAATQHSSKSLPAGWRCGDARRTPARVAALALPTVCGAGLTPLGARRCCYTCTGARSMPARNLCATRLRLAWPEAAVYAERRSLSGESGVARVGRVTPTLYPAVCALMCFSCALVAVVHAWVAAGSSPFPSVSLISHFGWPALLVWVWDLFAGLILLLLPAMRPVAVAGDWPFMLDGVRSGSRCCCAHRGGGHIITWSEPRGFVRLDHHPLEKGYIMTFGSINAPLGCALWLLEQAYCLLPPFCIMIIAQ